MHQNAAKGFTLIELMIVVVVITILAAFALPSYLAQVRKSHRSDATSTLGQAQLRQESWRAEHPAFGTLADINLASTSAGGYYTISILAPSGNCPNITPTVAASTANSYTIQASAIGSQAKDAGCATIILSSLCGTIQKTPATCWSK